jgi:hypothetical protein
MHARDNTRVQALTYTLRHVCVRVCVHMGEPLLAGNVCVCVCVCVMYMYISCV